jgi:3-oxoacyl-[acyl-carrier protein] reductase
MLLTISTTHKAQALLREQYAAVGSAAKAALMSLTRSWAKELAPKGVRVNAVAPGVIYTPFHERYSTPQMLEGFKASIPMNRIGTPDECAGAFLYLASDQLSSYVTGQIIEVNGGQYMP